MQGQLTIVIVLSRSPYFVAAIEIGIGRVSPQLSLASAAGLVLRWCDYVKNRFLLLAANSAWAVADTCCRSKSRVHVLTVTCTRKDYDLLRIREAEIWLSLSEFAGIMSICSLLNSQLNN